MPTFDVHRIWICRSTITWNYGLWCGRGSTKYNAFAFICKPEKMHDWFAGLWNKNGNLQAVPRAVCGQKKARQQKEAAKVDQQAARQRVEMSKVWDTCKPSHLGYSMVSFPGGVLRFDALKPDSIDRTELLFSTLFLAAAKSRSSKLNLVNYRELVYGL